MPHSVVSDVLGEEYGNPQERYQAQTMEFLSDFLGDVTFKVRPTEKIEVNQEKRGC